MKILLFGVSCVGKSTVGEILAKKLGYKYFDLDDEVYDNEEYKQSHRKELIREIKKDITCYGAKYKSIGMSGRFNINGDSAEAAADRLITEYNLKEGFRLNIVINTDSIKGLDQ